MDDFQMTYRYLFLDIDGVLHSSDAYVGVDNVKAPLQELRGLGLFAHLDLLTSLLVPHQDVSLVVHSSWRQTHDDEQLRLLFGPLAHLVVGATARELDRRLSILESIVRLRLEPARCRVLDDQPELLDGLEDLVIACDSRLGLADLTAQRQLQNWLDASRLGFGWRRHNAISSASSTRSVSMRLGRPPRHSGIEVIGDDYITPAGWSGELKFHAERIGECPSDEPLTIDAWDQS